MQNNKHVIISLEFWCSQNISPAQISPKKKVHIVSKFGVTLTVPRGAKTPDTVVVRCVPSDLRFTSECVPRKFSDREIFENFPAEMSFCQSRMVASCVCVYFFGILGLVYSLLRSFKNYLMDWRTHCATLFWCLAQLFHSTVHGNKRSGFSRRRKMPDISWCFKTGWAQNSCSKTTFRNVT